MPTVAGIVVAAGQGSRLAGDAGPPRPKGFAALHGAPLLVHAAGCLQRSGVITQLIVVVAEADRAAARDWLEQAGLGHAEVCAGGAIRQASVACGLAACAPGTEVVAVHDAARPLASPGLVAAAVRALEPPWVAVAPALPVVDTLKEVAEDGARVLGTLDRSRLRAVQTPQVFELPALARAHRAAQDAEATDDLALLEHDGAPVRLIDGEATNLKITYPADLEIAAALLTLADRRGRGEDVG